MTESYIDTPFFPQNLDEAFRRDGPLGVALAYASAGFKVFPCREKDDVFVKADGETVELKAKMPYVKAGDNPEIPGMGGHRAATTNPDIIRRWWRRWPNAMVGMPCAENGFFVVDIDRAKGDGQADGMDTIEGLERAHGPMEDAPTVETPSAGRHLYCALPDDGGPRLKNKAGVLPGIDIRSDGAITAPYSVRTDKGGAMYRLLTPTAPLRQASPWFLAVVRKAQEPRRDMEARPSAVRIPRMDGGDGTPYGLKALEGICDTISKAAEKTRNDTLNEQGFQAFRLVAGGQLGEMFAVEKLTEAGLASGLRKTEVEATVKSAMAGLNFPKAPKDDTPFGRGPARGREYQNQPGIGRTDALPPRPPRYVDGPIGDFYERAASPHPMAELRRGLTMETCEAYGVRYAEFWANPATGGADAASARLLLQPTKGSLVAMDAQGDAPTERLGGVQPFNVSAAWTSDRPVFVVEEEIDALSIIDVGGVAIALGGAGGAARFLDTVGTGTVAQPLILSFSSDEDGRKLTRFVREGLAGLKAQVYVYDLAEGYDGVNAALRAGRDALAGKVSAMSTAEGVRDTLHRLELDDIGRESSSAAMEGFFGRIESASTSPCFPTGFPRLDDILDGGLYPGLYVVGAISGLGKTTFCLQVVDNIAKGGQDVLVFSLEMARDELMAKSISRISYLRDMESPGYVDTAKTTRGILNGRRWQKYSDRDVAAIYRAAEDYMAFGPHVFITEGIGDVGIDRIKAKVERHIAVTGRRPVVLIDYLQIVAPSDPRATDKQNVDRAVLELKRMSRDFSIPVVGISSFNRENYQSGVNMAAFKESGAIEYSSDVVIGIQYRDMEGRKDENDRDRRARVQDVLAENEYLSSVSAMQRVQVKVLKNRNGRRGQVYFTLMPAFNCYAEDDDQTSDSGYQFGGPKSALGEGWTSCEDDGAESAHGQVDLFGRKRGGRRDKK